MGTYQAVIELKAEEREELTRWSKSRTLPAGDVLKARLILALADGKSYSAVEAELNTSRPTIARWKARFEKGRIAGLEGRHKGSRVWKATPAVQARLLKKTQQKPGRWQHALVVPEDGRSHWAEPGNRVQDLVENESEAASAGSLHGQQRSGVRREGGRDYRALHGTAAARSRFLRR